MKFILKTGEEVVFQCRDEGPLRARVKWSRQNGRPLHSHARDSNGRLEISSVTLGDSGAYTCSAEGYASIPGSSVEVSLKVEKCKLFFFNYVKFLIICISI